MLHMWLYIFVQCTYDNTYKCHVCDSTYLHNESHSSFALLRVVSQMCSRIVTHVTLCIKARHQNRSINTKLSHMWSMIIHTVVRLVGSLKLQVSFADYHLFYMALLQKRPIILRSLLIVATPYAFSDWQLYSQVV